MNLQIKTFTTMIVALAITGADSLRADELAADAAAVAHSFRPGGCTDFDATRLERLCLAADGRGLEALSAEVEPLGSGAGPTLRRLAAAGHPMGAGAAAEVLWRLAQRGLLSDDLAELAGEWLDQEDPVVASLAEWALAVKVGMTNGGQELRLPGDDPPAWYRRWVAQTPGEMLDSDYARLLISWASHHDSRKIGASVEKVIERAERAAGDVFLSTSPADTAAVQRQLDRLRAIRAEMARSLSEKPHDLTQHRRLWVAARRAARPIVLANPAIDFEQFVFVKCHAAHSHRNITGSQYPWIHKPGGDVFVQTGWDLDSPTRPVIDGQLGPGHVQGMDLWWDADRIVFGFASQRKWPPPYDTALGDDVFLLRADQEPTHLFEIHLDGTHLRQLTDHPYWSDLEPTYCADGSIVFASDRSGRSSECGKFSADHTVVNLYSLSPDGSTIARLNDNKDIDRHPHSLDNGLIAYTRWEYQERHFFEVHAVWTIRPDGTMADAVFNQHLRAPFGLRDTRSVPGSRKLVSIATGHHTFAYGPVVLVDPGGGPNWAPGIRSVTPHSLPEEGPPPGEAVAEGGVPDRGGLYQTPWALSERCFLVSYSHARPPANTSGQNNATGFALYLIDTYGNKELIHRDLHLSSLLPMPLRKRTRPPVLPPVSGPEEGVGTCFVANVADGPDGLAPGTVKYLRIAQRVGWPLDDQIGAMRWIPGNAWQRQFGFWSWAPVRILGMVPVEEDGSALFQVPAGEAVYFQALDENFMEVRRMRSHVTLQEGETRGCVGCHETRPVTPATPSRTPLTLTREPAVPEPPPWGAERLLGYEWLIQPILDAHCTRCHGDEEPEGGIVLSGTRADDGFVQSFRTLFGKKADGSQGPTWVSVSDRFSGASVSKPMEFGSHRSPLLGTLLDDPLHREEAKLPREQWIALTAWIDANAPYHDLFFDRRPDHGEPRRAVVRTYPVPPGRPAGR